MALTESQKRSNRERDRHQDLFDIAPLLALLADDAEAAAASLGVTKGTLQRWRTSAAAVAEGREPRPELRVTLSRRMADRYACRIGVHPAFVWRNW